MNRFYRFLKLILKYIGVCILFFCGLAMWMAMGCLLLAIEKHLFHISMNEWTDFDIFSCVVVNMGGIIFIFVAIGTAWKDSEIETNKCSCELCNGR